VSAKRFFMLGSDYVWPRTINKQLKGYWKSKGIPETAWKEEYVPLGFSNFQTLVNQIRAFADQGGGKPDRCADRGRLLDPRLLARIRQSGHQGDRRSGARARHGRGRSRGPQHRAAGRSSQLLGYLQNAKGAANVAFLKQWADYVKAKNVPFKGDVVIDPMVSAYDSVHLWAMAAAKANSFDVPEVRKAFAGLSLDCPSGYTLKMTAENNYVSRGVFIVR